MDSQDKNPITQSATKIVFIIISVALVVGLFTGKVESKDFIYIVGQVFAFYFGQKFATANNVNSQNVQQIDATPNPTSSSK